MSEAIPVVADAHRNEAGELVVSLLVTEPAFFDGHRKRTGEVFECAVALLKKDADGNHIIPSWAAPDSEGARQAVADKPDREAARFGAAAFAASGSVGNARRRAGFILAMAAGGDPKAEAAARKSSGDIGAKIRKADFDQHRPVDLPIPHISK